MYAGKLLFMFYVFTLFTYQAIAGNVEKNEASSRYEDYASSSGEIGIETAGRNQSEPEGPPDSHEAMNNRELKPKLTVDGRRKRSYEFLVGLVKRNASMYEITKNGKGMRATDSDVKASELLLELLVKIAANPQQWSKVHELLQKIDTDLIKSKQLVDIIKTTPPDQDGERKQIENIASHLLTAKSPWRFPAKNEHVSLPYQKNFAYHRVTGSPLTHSPASGTNKNPKAYIAVSVIAPKASESKQESVPIRDDEIMLENELKELKPWSHEQNLKNMADLRSRWVIQTDKKPLYAP